MKVKPMTEPQNVKLSGPGIAKTLPASFPAEFTIDAKNAGYGRPEVKIQVKILPADFHIYNPIVTKLILIIIKYYHG